MTCFWTFLCLPYKTTTRKCLISRFMEDVNTQRRIFLSLSKFECGPNCSTDPQEINWREIRVHLTFSANSFSVKRRPLKNTQIPFKSDYFSAVAVVNATRLKLPSHSSLWYFVKSVSRSACCTSFNNEHSVRQPAVYTSFNKLASLPLVHRSISQSVSCSLPRRRSFSSPPPFSLTATRTATKERVTSMP